MRPLLLLISLVFYISGALAQEQAPPATPESAPKPLPGLSEFVPRATQLSNEAAALPERLRELQKTEALEKEFERIKERSEKLRERTENLGPFEEWTFERLQDYKERLDSQAGALENLIDSISERLSSIEKLQQNWSNKKGFWNRWVAGLDETPPPADIRQEVFATIDRAQELVTGAAKPLLQLQDKIATFQREKLQRSAQIEALIKSLRTEVFERNAPSLSKPEFYDQFNERLMGEFRQGVRDALRWEENFLDSNGWLVGGQLALALTVGLFIRFNRRKSPEELDWQFVLDHPWATGVFISVIILSSFYGSAPALWTSLLWTAGMVSALVLIRQMYHSVKKLWLIYTLTTLFVITHILHSLNIPVPVFRLYQVFAVMGLGLLLLLALRTARRRDRPLYRSCLRGGLLVVTLCLAAQWLGYTTLANLAFEASIGTVLLYLLGSMGLRLGRGIIEFTLTHPYLKHYALFRDFGEELSHRLKGVLKVLILGYALLYLLNIWGIYESPEAAWEGLTDWGFSVGEFTFNIQTLLVAGAVFYGAIVFSWGLDALLETEVFPRKRIQRGVRDSIKRLLHYCILLIGLITAFTMAGFDLRALALVGGALGVGIGFGLQNVVNNFVSGLILLFERPVKLGDMLVLEETWGTVRKIGLRSTVMETLDQSEIIVPNSKLISETVTNWSLTTRQCRVVLPVGVSYGSDVEQVLRILNEVAKEHPEILEDPAPSPIFVGFGDSSLDFQFRGWIRDVKKRLVTISEIGVTIIAKFREEGVEIPFPQRDLHLRSYPRELFPQHQTDDERDGTDEDSAGKE